MKIVVITSDGYRHLMHEFAERFNRFWGVVPVTCLCYKYPLPLPDNFKVVSLGEQPEGKDWTSGLIPYFSNLFDSRFVLMLDDYMITERVDIDVVRQCYGISASKFDLTVDRKNFPHEYTRMPFIIQSSQTARYRSSLQAAVWDTMYFRRFLVPKRTPWEFELMGERDALNDGCIVLGTTCGVVKYENRMLKGVVR